MPFAFVISVRLLGPDQVALVYHKCVRDVNLLSLPCDSFLTWDS